MNEFLLDVIFPRFCVGCGWFGKYICEQCEPRIEYYEPQTCPYCELPSPFGLTHPRCQKAWGLDGMFILAHYQGIIPRIIHSVKYRNQFALLGEIAELIKLKYHGKFIFDYLVPVPLSKKREEKRGYNQAKKFAEKLSLPFTDYSLQSGQKAADSSQWSVVNLLVRTRETKPQFELKYDDRKQNMKDAFSLNPALSTVNREPALRGYSFCLVDDVATTGATIFECAKVLKRSGAEKVYAICIARGG